MQDKDPQASEQTPDPQELRAEAEGMVLELETLSEPSPVPPEPDPTPAAPADPGGDFLEETLLPSTVENHGVQSGSQLSWGGLELAVGAALPGGWFAAKQGQTPVLLKPDLDGSLLSGLGNHKLLPKLLYSGPEGLVVEAPEGQPVGRKLSLKEALEVITPLAQFLYFLERKGLTLIDLEPSSLLHTAEGLKLVPPPRLGKLGANVPPLWREGYTPPEVLAEATISSKTGVYLLGALLFELMNGAALPVEGPSELLLGGVPVGGVPQILTQLLESVEQRATPQQALTLLKQLAEPGQPVLILGAVTNVGLNPTRPVNEDSYSFRFERIGASNNDHLLLRVCVSDGMGGMAAGEVASQAAVESFVSGSQPHPLDDPQAQSDWATRLVWDANQAVLEAMKGADGGCTLTGVIFVGARYALGHVGDTRAYLWNGELRHLTQDHSLVAAMVKSGILTEEEAQHHPDRNKVLRSMGNLRHPQDGYVDSLATVTGQPTAVLEVGQMMLLVSDGVWGEVDDPVIAEVMAQNPDPQRICEILVQKSLEAGAPDNVTAVVVKRLS